MLFRLKGQAGLEIQTREGQWVPVPVCPPGTESDAEPPILVNIGDLLSHWTNGLLRSTVHRVVFSSHGGKDQSGTSGNSTTHHQAVDVVNGETDLEPRYSIAFFCHPVGTTPLDPVPSERVRQFKAAADAASFTDAPTLLPSVQLPAKPRVLTADEHLQMRLHATYLTLYDKQGKNEGNAAT